MNSITQFLPMRIVGADRDWNPVALWRSTSLFRYWQPWAEHHHDGDVINALVRDRGMIAHILSDRRSTDTDFTERDAPAFRISVDAVRSSDGHYAPVHANIEKVQGMGSLELVITFRD